MTFNGKIDETLEHLPENNGRFSGKHHCTYATSLKNAPACDLLRS